MQLLQPPGAEGDWSVGVALAGYWLGSSVHNIDRYLLPIIAVIVFISLLPIGIEATRNRRIRRSPA